MNRNIRRLPDAEQEVMQALWACQVPAARTDIEEILFQTHPMAMTTLLTLLTRLSERGFVKIEKEGRRSLYTPCISREEYLASQSKSFFEKLCGGNLSVFASALCDSGLSREEIAQLRTLLERGEL
ncbi:MAG: BlaI/MecI/CopY family transcriptional regulator [Lachnospiraceae bacterium]|nr:BlaI/MecI/CopY family transcriptional regulator [Lachnospiraceae bacterium]